jgi:acetoin utilization protein AcuB
MRRARDVMTPHPVVVRPDDTLETCARTMASRQVRHLVVATADQRIAGMVTEATVLEHGRLSAEGWIPSRPERGGGFPVSRATTPVATVGADTPISEMLHRLLDDPEDAVVVVDEDRVPVGIFTEHDVCRLASTELPDGLRVRKVAATDLVAGEPDASLEDAWRTMQENDIRHLPVMKGTGRLIGIVSLRDLREAAGSIAGAGTLQEIVTPIVATIAPDSPLKEAARRMARHKVECLAVLDEAGGVFGLVTSSDLLKVLISQDGQSASAS